MRRSFPIVLTLLLGCGGAIREAESLVEDGALADAERVLTAEIAEHPANLEAVLLRGDVRLRQRRFDDAAADFVMLRGMPKWRKRIAASYWEIAQSARDDETRSLCAVQAAKENPDLTQRSCELLRDTIRERSPEVSHSLLAAAASIGYACSSKCTADLASSMRAENDAGRIVRMARTAAEAEPKAAPAMAAAMLDAAERFGRQRQNDALLLVREALILDRSLEPDRRVTAVRGRVDTWQAPPPARRRFLEGTELEVTAQALGIVGAAIHQYFDYHRRLPPSGTMATLERHLVPHFLSQPYTDGWGGMIHYAAEGWRFRVVSAGVDGRVSPESLDLRRAPRGVVDDYGADVIWQGGVVQAPVIESPSPWPSPRMAGRGD